MNQTRLLALVCAAVLALAGGWYFGTATRPSSDAAIDTGQLMFPGLAPKLTEARRIEITAKGKTLVVALKDNVWGVEDHGGYRVTESKLRGMLTALTELRLVEPRTADPTQYTRLGVETPSAEKDSTASLLTVLDGAGKPIVTLIAGHRRTRTQGNVPEQIYVRRPNEAQSWLAEGGLQVDTDAQVWLDRAVINVSNGQIMKVVSTKGNETIELWRDDTKLKVTVPAEHPPLEDYKLDDVARALESLTFQDVKRDSEPLGEPAGSAVFTTLDGLEIHVTVSHLEKDSWTRIKAVGKPEAADKLNAKLAGWAFQTGLWKDKALIPGIADLAAPPPPQAGGAGMIKPEAPK